MFIFSLLVTLTVILLTVSVYVIDIDIFEDLKFELEEMNVIIILLVATLVSITYILVTDFSIPFTIENIYKALKYLR